MIHIRPARLSDLDRILHVLRYAIADMEKHGIFQWDEAYPDKTLLESDITNGHMYVTESDGTVAGFVTLNEEEEPEYITIQWCDITAYVWMHLRKILLRAPSMRTVDI